MFLKKFERFIPHYANCQQRALTTDSTTSVADLLNLPKLWGLTGEEVMEKVDLTNKTCLITGATSGIGAEIVRCLMKKNCNIAMACRNPYAAQVLSKNVWEGAGQLKTYYTNLLSLRSVRNASEEILKEESKIDIVILNAAVFGIPWTFTEDMFETIFQVNFLSQLYLLLNIEKNLASDARVVFMSSNSHRNIKWKFEDTMEPTLDMICLPKDKYTSIKAYNISKLCGICAMHYLNYYWANIGRSVFCAHPGSFVKTNLCTNWWPYEALYMFMYPFSKSIAHAAATPLYCATSPDLQGCSDLFIENCQESEPSDLSQDTLFAHRIIDLSKSVIMERTLISEKVTKTTYDKQIKEPLTERPTETSSAAFTYTSNIPDYFLTT